MKKSNGNERRFPSQSPEIMAVVLEAREDQMHFGPTSNLVFPHEDFDVERVEGRDNV